MFVLDELLELLLLLLLDVAADRAARALSLNSLMSGKELTENKYAHMPYGLPHTRPLLLTHPDQNHTLDPTPDTPGD